MGKPTGFLEYNRELPADRVPMERLKDWQELYEDIPEEQLKKQGARCMDTTIPHTESFPGYPPNITFTGGCPI